MSQLNVKGWTITSDSRFAILAKLYPYDPADGSGYVNRDHALGNLMHGWYEALERQNDVFSKAALAYALKQPEHRVEQLFDALQTSELGERIEGENVFTDSVRLRGCGERNSWLEEVRKKKSKAGKASGKARRQKANTRSNTCSNKTRTPNEPIVIANANVIANASDLNTSTPRKRASTSHPDHKAFVQFFDELYAKHHGGAKPTWGGKAGALVKRLLTAHGIDECKRRAEILFTAAPNWITGRDLQTLSAQFDKLATKQQRLAIGRAGGVGGHVLQEREYPNGEVDL